jgi:hypothetical protein
VALLALLGLFDSIAIKNRLMAGFLLPALEGRMGVTST